MEDYRLIEEWFLLYGSDVRNYLVYYLGKRDVDDLVQEVFIKALKGLPQFEGRSSPKTWLFSIARRIGHDDQRKHRLRNLLILRLNREVEELEKTPEEHFSVQEELERVKQLIYKLKGSYREVIILRILEDLSVTETAEILGWTENKVSVTLHRALRALRRKLAQLEGGMEIVS